MPGGDRRLGLGPGGGPPLDPLLRRRHGRRGTPTRTRQNRLHQGCPSPHLTARVVDRAVQVGIEFAPRNPCTHMLLLLRVCVCVCERLTL